MRALFYQGLRGGGIGIYSHYQLQALQSIHGVSAELLCPPEYRPIEPPAYACSPRLCSIPEQPSSLRRFKYALSQLLDPLRAARHVARTRPTLLHFCTLNHLTYPLWSRTAALRSLPWAVTVHDVGRGYAAVNGTWEAEQLAAFYRRCAALFVHGTGQRDELLAMGVLPDRIHQIPMGPISHGPVSLTADACRAQWGVPTDRQLLLFFGQIRNDKNFATVLRALTLAKSRPHLLVVGSCGSGHTPADDYHRLIDELDIGNRVTWRHGGVPDPEVANTIAACDAVLIPQGSGFTSQSAVLSIAMSYGRPVVSGAAPSIAEAVDTCASGVSAADDSPAAVARAMDAVLTQAPSHWAPGIERFKLLYRWEENARRLAEVYAELPGAAS